MQTISIKQTCMLLDLLRCVLVILLETCDGLGFFIVLATFVYYLGIMPYRDLWN